MISLNENCLFPHIDISYKNLKFKRAFQFLQLLVLQRVYGINILTHSSIRRSYKQQQHCELEVFLGGSCNPTKWRYEQAIPYFQSRSISYYNPQVENWTPDLVEIEHRVKESAPVLLFVIDYSTRSLAAIAETCYLAARGKNLIVVMNTMPDDKNQIKFIQQKNSDNEKDNEKDYENVCHARHILRLLLQNRTIPIFDNIKNALECVAFLIENIRFQLSDEYHNSTTTESDDDDGYGSSISSDHILSRSTSSIVSDFYEYSSDHHHQDHRDDSLRTSRFYTLCTSPFRFIKKLLHPSSIIKHSNSSLMFDLYIASGDYDDCWLNTSVYPILKEINVNYIKREISYDNDQIDNHRRKRSRLLYYLINDNERLSYLTTELAYLIGERQYHIIVYLQPKINENSEEILTKTERQDIERSRKYLGDLAKKENIFLYQSREQSWQHVLAFLLRD